MLYLNNIIKSSHYARLLLLSLCRIIIHYNYSNPETNARSFTSSKILYIILIKSLLFVTLNFNIDFSYDLFISLQLLLTMITIANGILLNYLLSELVYIGA